MTDSIPVSLRYLPPAFSAPRDRVVSPALHPSNPAPQPSGRRLPVVPEEDTISMAIMLGLVALTLPAMVYSLAEAWQLASGETLAHAIRAFVL